MAAVANLHDDAVGRGHAIEAVVADKPLVANGRHLDGVAVPHDSHGGEDGPAGEVGIVDGAAGLVEHQVLGERDGLQEREESAVFGLGESGQEAIPRRSRGMVVLFGIGHLCQSVLQGRTTDGKGLPVAGQPMSKG